MYVLVCLHVTHLEALTILYPANLLQYTPMSVTGTFNFSPRELRVIYPLRIAASINSSLGLNYTLPLGTGLNRSNIL